MFKRSLTFWFASLVGAAAIAAYEVFVLKHVEPDFGAPPGSFAVDFVIFAVFGLLGAICHGAAALFLRRTVADAPNAVLTASLSAVTFQLLVYALPLKVAGDLRALLPLVLVIGLGVSALFLLLSARLAKHSYRGAA